MKNLTKTWEDVINKYYKSVKPQYLRSIKEQEDKHINCIKNSVVIYKGTFSESDILDYNDVSFGDMFKKPFRTQVASIEENIKKANVILKGFGSGQSILEELILNAEAYNRGMEENPDLILSELADFKRKRWKNE